MTNYSLFSSASEVALEERLHKAFADWLEYRRSATSRRRSLNEESTEVYREMWNAFVAFFTKRSVDLHELTSAELEAFIASRGVISSANTSRPTTSGVDLTPRYARRFLTLIDWVCTFQAKMDGVPANNSARAVMEKPQYKYANASDKDPLPEFLTDAQSKQLIEYVTRRPSNEHDGQPEKWNVIRNRTAVALMLGAGLTPGDVRNLKTDGVHVAGGKKAGVPWKLSLPGNGNFPARETPLATWAGRQLVFWLKMREEQGIAGDYVFPARKSGGQWSDTRCYEMTREVLEHAGLDKVDGGVFKLRHTFALRQLARGQSEKEVAQWLGLLDINGMARYRRVLSSPAEVV